MNSKRFLLINMTTLFFLLFTFSSCFVPGSKSSYIANFERFVKDVERNRSEFKAKDWRWANKRFGKYSGEWYNKFESELSVEELVKVNMLKARYMVVRTTSETGRMADDFLEEDLNKMGKDVKDYLDKNLEKDLKEINRGAREIGDSAVKVMEDILKDIKK